MFDRDRLEEIKRTFKNLTSLTEENIKIKIVVELLKNLGYEIESFDFENIQFIITRKELILLFR